MLTAIDDEYTQVTSFDEQADNYITKPFSMVLLGRRVTALLRRSGKGIIPDTVTFGDVTVDFSGYTAQDPNGKIDVTPKEIDLHIAEEITVNIREEKIVMQAIQKALPFSLVCSLVISVICSLL